MRKICFLTGTLGYGGATKILVDVANYLADYFDVVIANYGDTECFYHIDYRIKVINTPCTKCKIPRIRLYAQMMLTRKFFRNLHFDAFMAFGNTEKLLALSAAMFRREKVIFSERQDPFNYHPGRKHTMWKRYILADGCIFQTEGARDYFPKSVQKKSVVIPNFIYAEKKPLTSLADRKKEIAFIARFELKQKRQDIMVKAMRIINQKHPDWRLIFYGDGPDQSAVEHMVRDYNLEKAVIFAGKTANVGEKLYKSGLMALSADYEGIPNVILEAMALGIPVIATDCSPGGARFLIQDQENGRLVSRGDARELAEVVNYCIEHIKDSDRYAANAYRSIDEYSPQMILPQWKKYIELVLEER